MQIRTDRPAPAWSGRDDGPGPEHRRVFQAVRPLTSLDSLDGPAPDAVFIGFASDAGVARNQGRTGAAEGPTALRSALGTLALARAFGSDRRADLSLADAGDILVEDDQLEDGQDRLGQSVAATIDAGSLPVVLGGGHEVAYGTYLGVATSALRQQAETGSHLGILNLDAHFDLRTADRATSGTPFSQALARETETGGQITYAVIGISEAANTQALFDTADTHGVPYLIDEEVTWANTAVLDEFLATFLASVDLVYLTLDLDVLPAAVAPGVSAPAALGVDPAIINRIIGQVAASGKLAVFDVAELNPSLDIDGRTAKTAARLIHTALTRHTPLTGPSTP
ncbi:formimidoylglutamase [Rothia nasimurium]|uniref:formimidoylglutamase n=1 Tax=Rothia nasimurium TaxID=85336 RepID=UPI001F02549B|nr:formimidoylglutamase [Rothia nasimurium]